MSLKRPKKRGDWKGRTSEVGGKAAKNGNMDTKRLGEWGDGPPPSRQARLQMRLLCCGRKEGEVTGQSDHLVQGLSLWRALQRVLSFLSEEILRRVEVRRGVVRKV